ncbi:hypothetical protein [Permianibacter aggregans]|uniref:hypothetical protein n=1 Tax=Permianibacter aggregans TaxID=1510150 RepID=UPI0010606B5C|nr:hypothetical protein [Permianibacter aggregans]QGX40172.1 hypothetical protein E2H98_11015 [Permianibacter aggregans]
MSKEEDSSTTVSDDSISVPCGNGIADRDPTGKPSLSPRPPASMRARSVLRIESNRFNWLNGRSINRVPPIKTEEGIKQIFLDIDPGSELSTGPFTSTLNETSKLEVQSLDPQWHTTNQQPAQRLIEPKEHQAQFNMIVHALCFLESIKDRLKNKGSESFLHSWSVISLGQQTRTRRLDLDSLVPTTNVWDCDRWCCVRETPLRPRMYQWFELETKLGAYYILEIEPQHPVGGSANGTYILQFGTGQKASFYELSHFIDRLVTEKEARTMRGMLAYNWKRTSVHHTEDREIERLASSIVKAVARLS